MGDLSDDTLSIDDPVSKGVEIPDDCTSASDCSYFATHFLKKGGVLSFDAVLLGGVAKKTMKMEFKTGKRFDKGRLLKFLEADEVLGGAPRALSTTGSWDP